jgi:O-antigen/teichoic acid export membrane protein
MKEQSLTNKTVKGVGWNTIDRIANYGIGFIVGIVLARLLSPEEYGLIGIIGIFTAVFNVILDSGLSTALIRKKDVTNEDYCTVFYVNIFLSIVLTFILYQGAPLISTYFKRPELTPYIHVMSFILVINALSLTQQAKLTKRIDFKTQTKISLIAHILSGVIGIAMAYTGFGVWALVAQQMTSRLFTTILLWIYNKWIPGFIFSWNSFKTLFGFSWKLLVASILSVLSNQVYEAVIGRNYSPATLGQYTRAKQYSHLCSSSIGDMVLKVSLPVMSEIQDNNARLLSGYRKIIKTTMFVTFVIMLGMAACAKSFIFVLIGEKWLPCVPMMQIISFSLMLYPLHRINLNMLTVQGRSDILLYLEIIKIALSVIPILMGIYVGFYWMLIGTVIMGIVAFFLNSFYSGRVLHYTSWDQIKDLIPSFCIAMTMAVIVYLLSFIPLSYYILLPVQVITGAIVTFILCELIKPDEYIQLKVIVLDYMNKLRHRNSK